MKQHTEFQWEIITEWINNVYDLMGLFSVYLYAYVDVHDYTWIYILEYMLVERA